jgi:hypothetical protein
MVVSAMKAPPAGCGTQNFVDQSIVRSDNPDAKFVAESGKEAAKGAELGGVEVTELKLRDSRIWRR